jgi:hypothetical protein
MPCSVPLFRLKVDTHRLKRKQRKDVLSFRFKKEENSEEEQDVALSTPLTGEADVRVISEFHIIVL